MTPIEVKILTGPSKGAKEIFHETPVTFGRAADCNIVVPDTTVSRNHGELRFEKDRWVLANLSPNGTLLGRKNITKKTRPIQQDDVISVGDMQLFQVSLPEQKVVQNEEPEAATTAKPVVQQGLDRKTKVWIGVGVYFFLMILIIIVLSNSGGDGPSTGTTVVLSEKEIELEIRELVTVDVPNAAAGNGLLIDARAYLNSQRADPDAKYQAYLAYKTAMAHLETSELPDPGEHLQFKQLEGELIAEVVERYKRGVALFEKRAWKEAEAEFRALKRFYSDSRSQIYTDAGKKQAHCRRQMGT